MDLWGFGDLASDHIPNPKGLLEMDQRGELANIFWNKS